MLKRVGQNMIELLRFSNLGNISLFQNLNQFKRSAEEEALFTFLNVFEIKIPKKNNYIVSKKSWISIQEFMIYCEGVLWKL